MYIYQEDITSVQQRMASAGIGQVRIHNLNIVHRIYLDHDRQQLNQPPDIASMSTYNIVVFAGMCLPIECSK